MNRTIKALALLAILPIAACNKVPAGNVGVKVHLLGSDKGVDTEVLNPGRYWIGWNQDLFIFPTFTQNYTWTQSKSEGGSDNKGGPEDESISFQTIEGLSVSADIGISYHIEADKVSLVFQKYRKGVEEITDIYLRNLVRNALVTQASTRPIETVYGSGKADLIEAVRKEVADQVAPLGIIVEQLNWVGDLRLPATVVASINNKIQATQQAQQRENEVATAKAQAQIEVAKAQGTAQSLLVNAAAEAQANKLVAESITPVLVQWESIKHWDGKLPQFTGGGALPFINVPSPAK